MPAEGVIKAGLKLGRKALARAGLAVFRFRPDHRYVPDLYGRTARKHVDVRQTAPFGTLAETVIRHKRTRLHYDRLYTIYQALRHVARQTAAPAAEIHLAEAGVYRGGTSYFIAATAQALGLASAHVHCFDTFSGHAAQDIRPKEDRARVHAPGTFGDTSSTAVRRYLADFERVHLHVGRLQETCAEVRDTTFSFVHLDMDIYEPTLFGLEFFDGHLAPAGVIVLDDYGFMTCPGVSRAVEVFLASRPRYYMHHLLTGQCLLVRLADSGR
jgi:hypothetical protein